jgi:Type I phosphodiesterase / nucleotide pyrophosphatase
LRRNLARSLLVAAIVALPAPGWGAATAPTPATPAALAAPPTPVSRVLIVSIDGLRPDLLLRADTPTMHALMARGAFTMWASTTDLAVTLPSHVSMLTGVTPGKHGITWNTTLPLSRPVYPAWPTLFELARKAGFTTAMMTGKSKFSALAKPGTLNWSYVPSDQVITDDQVTVRAVQWIARYEPQVFFVHLPEVDSVGHGEGWGSAAQLAAIAEADRCIGRLLDALRARGVLDSTVVLVSSDHGGAGKTHGPDDTRSREIPWIVAGPGICPDVDLTTFADLNVRTEDTFATVCWLLGVTVTKPIDGRPVTEIECATSTR